MAGLLLCSPLFAGDAGAAADSGKEVPSPPPCKRLAELPFRSGEKIHYCIRWGVFSVGSATMEYTGPVDRDGAKEWQVVLTAQTNSFADRIFKVRDWNAVWVDEAFTRPLHYVKKQHEGGTHRDVIVTFDWDRNKAQYSGNGNLRDEIDIVPGSWDPLGITYAVRALDLEGVEHISIPSTDGKKSVTTEIGVSGPVTIKVPAGSFETLVLSPDIKDLGGVFKKSDKAGITIWFSRDARHLPVRMASKVAVGSFVAEMTSVEIPPDPPAEKPADKGKEDAKPDEGKPGAPDAGKK